MRNNKMMIGLGLAAALLLTACASDPGSPEARYELYKERQEAKADAARDVVDNIPDWFIDPPQSDYAVYTVGSGVSPSMDMALTKASLSAKRQLADRTAGELSEVIREFATEVGSTDDPSVFEEMERATKNVIRNTPVYGYRITEKEISVSPNGSFVAYVLLEYGDEEINKVLKRVLESQRMAEKDERKKELYDQLEKEVDTE